MSNLAPSPLLSHAKIFLPLVFLLLPTASTAETDSNEVQELRAQVDQLKELVTDLQARVTLLEGRDAQLRATRSGDPDDAVALSRAALSLRRDADAPPPATVSPQQVTPVPSSASQLPTTLPGGATLNFYLDGYFENNFNNPVGRVNDLRAYDVLSRTFSINQADVIFERDPDLNAHRATACASTCNMARPRRRCRATPPSSLDLISIAISSRPMEPISFLWAKA